MHRYFIKTPWIVKKIFPHYYWRIETAGNEVYLTFDDGPHPQITPWVLDELKKYNALATFFCIGKNVEHYPLIYKRILEEGHAVGNHTYHHYNGWTVSDKVYREDVAKAAGLIHTALFRPPYGRIKRSQAKEIGKAMEKNAKIIMWDVLSADFDPSFSPEQCLQNVLRHVQPGSIVVFHDSEKAYKNLVYALPVVLKQLRQKNYGFKRLEG